MYFPQIRTKTMNVYVLEERQGTAKIHTKNETF